jgi:hypothetical protein
LLLRNLHTVISMDISNLEKVKSDILNLKEVFAALSKSKPYEELEAVKDENTANGSALNNDYIQQWLKERNMLRISTEKVHLIITLIEQKRQLNL